MLKIIFDHADDGRERNIGYSANVRTNGVRKGGFGVKTPLELDILQKLYLRKGWA